MTELRLVVDIPFAPPKAASPNSRVHWSKRSKAAKVYREAAYIAGCVAITGSGEATEWWKAIDGGAQISLAWTIYWPKHGRKNDYVQAVARLKAAEDGIADALVVDDRDFAWESVQQERDPEGRGRTVAVVTARKKE